MKMQRDPTSLASAAAFTRICKAGQATGIRLLGEIGHAALLLPPGGLVTAIACSFLCLIHSLPVYAAVAAPPPSGAHGRGTIWR
jgi:hypothetical protein